MHPAHRIGCVPKYLDGKNFWCALDPRAPIAQVRVIPITGRSNPKSRVIVIWIVTDEIRQCTVFCCAEGLFSISPSGFKSDWSKLIRIGRVNDVARQRLGFSETPSACAVLMATRAPHHVSCAAFTSPTLMVSDITDGCASAAPAQAIRGARETALAKPRRRIDWNIVKAEMLSSNWLVFGNSSALAL